MQVFGSVWGSALQDTRTKLQKLLNLWKGHFPESVLQAASAHITAAASSAPTAAPGVAAVRPVSAQQPLQGYSLAGQPALVAAQPGFQAFAGFPMAVTSTGNGTYATFGQPLQLPVGAGAAPMGAQLVLGGMPMMAGQPVMLQQHIMVAGPPASAAMVVAPAAGGAPPSPTPVPQWMQQPAPAFAIQQQQQQPPPPPARSKRSPSPSMLGSAAGGQQQGPGALAQMLGNLAAGGLLSQPGLPAEDPALRITTFDPAFIKVLWRTLGVVGCCKALPAVEAGWLPSGRCGKWRPVLAAPVVALSTERPGCGYSAHPRALTTYVNANHDERGKRVWSGRNLQQVDDSRAGSNPGVCWAGHVHKCS
jgi:hypothetical protein